MTWFVYLVIPGGLIAHTMERGSFESLEACQQAGQEIAQKASDDLSGSYGFGVNINWYCKRREPPERKEPKITHLKEHDEK